MVLKSFQDIINEQLSPTSGSLSAGALLLSLALAFIAGLFIFYVYKRTFTGILYNRNFNVSLVLVALVTAMIIKTITSNLVLSLGMVGALSIVRFRTAVKEPMDTVFMFWAVAAGITIGAGFYFIGVLGTFVIGIFLYIMNLVRGHGDYAYLLIVRHDFESTNEVNYTLRKLPRGSRLKSKTVSSNGVEITVEVRLPGDNTNLVTELLRIDGVFDATLVSYQGDYAS
jgi:uncharacterized membrane protein YhiD involved in acid resistance